MPGTLEGKAVGGHQKMISKAGLPTRDRAIRLGLGKAIRQAWRKSRVSSRTCPGLVPGLVRLLIAICNTTRSSAHKKLSDSFNPSREPRLVSLCFPLFFQQNGQQVLEQVLDKSWTSPGQVVDKSWNIRGARAGSPTVRCRCAKHKPYVSLNC